jgi:DNA-binding transcriptional LysR family regulator
MLHDGEKLVEAIHLIGEGQRGRLDAGISGSLEHRGFFQCVLAPYHRRHPQSHVSVRFGHSPALAHLVQQRELDLAYMQKRAFEPSWWAASGLEYEPLHYGSFVFFVGPQHQLAARRTVSPDELEEHPFIVSPKEHEENARIGALLRAAGLTRQRGLVEMEGMQSRMLAAEAGLGVLPAFLLPCAGPEAFAPLRRLQLTTPPPRVEYGLVGRRDEPWSPLMRDFAEQLRTAGQPDIALEEAYAASAPAGTVVLAG